MKHPSEIFIRYMLVKNPSMTDDDVQRTLNQWGILSTADNYLGELRVSMLPTPAGFDPLNRLHRSSIQYLRDQGVYELFFPTPASSEAWDILADPTKRMTVEQALLARLDLRQVSKKLNAKNEWHLTAEGMAMFRHVFWNVKSLTFDEWGRYLYGRTALYERYMALLQAPPHLAFHHLRLDQIIESKNMIKRTQEIAYFALEEAAQRPGVGMDKVKAIGVLGKVVTDCHAALNTSDMALKDVLKEFERFRMDHPHLPPKDIKQLAPTGNYSGSGAKQAIVLEAEKVPS